MASLKITSDTDLVRIDLTDGDWIEVKRALGKDDERRRTSILLRGQRRNLAGGVDAREMDMGAFYDAAPFATLEVALKRWSLKNPETNRVAPITHDTIRAIGDEDMEIINAEMEKLYGEPLSEEDAKNS